MKLITSEKPTSIEGYREAARRNIPNFLMRYMEGGAATEQTLRTNSDDWQQYQIRQRAFGKDTLDPDTSTKILGEDYPAPIILGPIGLAGALNPHHEEVAAALAAEKLRIPFTLSTMSVSSIGKIAENVDTPPWFQLYMHHDRGFTKRLLQRVKESGSDTLVWSVDRPVGGERHFEWGAGGLRDVFSGSAGGMWRLVKQLTLRPTWAWTARKYVDHQGRPKNLFGNIGYAVGENATLADARSWLGKNVDVRFIEKDLDFIRDNWKGKLIVKGIMDVEDAKMLAGKEGVDGIIISNHGGRQQDGTSSTASALPHIASVIKETNPDMTILVDGGIYNAQNIFRALALGADGVLLGRAWAWGLAAHGQDGVEHIVNILQDGLRQTMAMASISSIDQIDETCVNFLNTKKHGVCFIHQSVK